MEPLGTGPSVPGPARRDRPGVGLVLAVAVGVVAPLALGATLLLLVLTGLPRAVWAVAAAVACVLVARAVGRARGARRRAAARAAARAERAGAVPAGPRTGA